MCSNLVKNHGYPHVLVVLAVLQLIITCPGCSVKEDRDLCPCMLELDASGDEHSPDSLAFTLAGYSGAADGFLVEGQMAEHWKSMVPRGEMYLAAVRPSVTGTSPSLPSRGRWIAIDVGRECPRVWTSCRRLSTRNERMSVPLALHKEYCELTIFVRDISGGSFPYRLEVRGNVDGYLIDGTPSEGLFLAPAEYVDGRSSAPADIREAHVLLPRQLDSSLLLDIISDDDRSRTFAIGNYIESSGYDWSSQDLKDIVLDIDYASTTITFRISSWQHTAQFEVVI